MSTAPLLQQWYEEVWNNRQELSIDKLMHKDVIIHGLDPIGVSNGIDYFKSFYHNFRESFPQIHINVQILVSDEEFSTGFCRVTARSSTGREIAFNGLSVGKFKQGKLIESWNHFDFLKMYQQLGHILVSEIAADEKSNLPGYKQ